MFNSDIEILAPCGSFDILKTAIKAGADACYIGGSRFGARAYADNVSDIQLEDAIDYTHLHGKKLYLTVNTLIKENELSDAYNYIKTCYESGIDAFIVQDLGLFKLIRDSFPNVHIHCSTQMNITSYYAAAYMKKQGASRIVTAREMSLEEIRLIKENVDIEVETFVHGAMCYSYSGQCLMSSLAGGRSGNRGRCAQPCRKCYEGQYILSMKDMCALELIPKLADAGIDSFKIEGRMKNEYYVASAVDAYKELTNDYLNGTFSDKKALKYKFRLANIYNRGGFCDGYFFMHNGPDMISKDRPNNRGVLVGTLKNIKDGRILIGLKEDLYKGDVLEIKLNDKSVIEITSGVDEKAGKDVWLNAPKTRMISIGTDVYRTRCNHLIEEIKDIIPKDKIALNAIFTAKIGEPLSIEISFADFIANSESENSESDDFISIKIDNEIVQKSNSRPCDKELIKEKLNQINDTDYYFKELFIIADNDAFVPASLIKKLRLEAIAELEKKHLLKYKRKSDGYISLKTYDKDFRKEDKAYVKPRLKIGIKTPKQLETVLKYPDIYGVYMDKILIESITGSKLMEDINSRNIKVFLNLPYVIHGYFDYDDYTDGIEFDGLYVRNIDAFSCEIDYNKNVVLGAGLYAYNNIARKFLEERNNNVVFELPKELNVSEIKALNDMSSELCIYEHQQVMLSANCIKKSRGLCDKKREIIRLKDDKSNSFYDESVCSECVNVIYNGIPYLYFDKDDIIKDCRTSFYRMNFTSEDEKTTDIIMKYYYEGKKPDMIFTTGHMYRGVE
ncbi:MAG: U32 family peptidase [Lachnospiraceae bacterium]|nr:U32 family peptidase [Lachnospiraceae bacterium]